MWLVWLFFTPSKCGCASGGCNVVIERNDDAVARLNIVTVMCMIKRFVDSADPANTILLS